MNLIMEFIMWIFFLLPMTLQDFFRKLEREITEGGGLWTWLQSLV